LAITCTYRYTGYVGDGGKRCVGTFDAGERETSGDVEHVACVLGECDHGDDFAAFGAGDGLDGLVFWTAADGDGADAGDVFEFFVEGGAAGAAEGVGEHDDVFGVEEGGACAVDEVEARGDDGDAVCA